MKDEDPTVPVSPRHHRLDYLEWSVASAEALASVKRFYGDAFGWSFTPYGPAYVGIRRRPDDEHELGGIAVMTPGAESEDQDIQASTGNPQPVASGSPQLLPVLWSDDLDRSLASVTRAGGQIVKPIFSFPGGRRFEFNDPAGVRLAVWASPNPDPE